MSSRQHAVVDPKRSDLIQLTVVRTDTLVQDHPSYLLLSDVVKNRVDVLGVVRIDLLKVLLGVGFDSVHVVLSLQLVDGLDSFSHLAFGVPLISAAAAFVKVVIRNRSMSVPSSIRSLFMRSTRTVVLPDPAAAETRMLLPLVSIVSRCSCVR